MSNQEIKLSWFFNFLLALLLPNGNLFAQKFNQIPVPISGKIDRIDSFSSRYVKPRNIDIWLPEGYSSKKKYAVIYMHDGQMLFDSNMNWNKQEWKVDETLSQLASLQKIKECIVVGIWNTGNSRYADYFPEKPFLMMNKEEREKVLDLGRKIEYRKMNEQKPVSDSYLRFLVEELKPMVDKKYATMPDRKHTFIAGSSMGGLISWYALCEYPQIFGAAACLSTHWPGIFTNFENPVPAAFLKYLSQKLPKAGNHRFYFDHGTATLDSLYEAHQQKVDSLFNTKGYNKSNFKSLKFDGANHSENAWAKRLDIPFLFLVGKKLK
jgi:predicted alpha/beta superfamily hydrolase